MLQDGISLSAIVSPMRKLQKIGAGGLKYKEFAYPNRVVNIKNFYDLLTVFSACSS